MRVNTTTLAFTAGLYLAPKVLTYLTTDPCPHIREREIPLTRDIENIFLRFRKNAAAWTKYLMYHVVGWRHWDFITRGIMDNAWISYLFISIFFSGPSAQQGVVKYLMLATIFIGANGLAFTARWQLSKKLEHIHWPTACFIAPRKPWVGPNEYPPLPPQEPDPVEENPIPERFRNDHFLSSSMFICPITGQPSADFVTDPTTEGKMSYSKAGLERWLRESATSPMTREPLQLTQCSSSIVRSMFIQNRIAFLEERENRLRAAQGAENGDSHDS
jgi:hypothetical protein